MVDSEIDGRPSALRVCAACAAIAACAVIFVLLLVLSGFPWAEPLQGFSDVTFTRDYIKFVYISEEKQGQVAAVYLLEMTEMEYRQYSTHRVDIEYREGTADVKFINMRFPVSYILHEADPDQPEGPWFSTANTYKEHWRTRLLNQWHCRIYVHDMDTIQAPVDPDDVLVAVVELRMGNGSTYYLHGVLEGGPR